MALPDRSKLGTVAAESADTGSITNSLEAGRPFAENVPGRLAPTDRSAFVLATLTNDAWRSRLGRPTVCPPGTRASPRVVLVHGRCRCDS